VNREGAEVTSAGRAFQTHAPATEKARRPTVGSLTYSLLQAIQAFFNRILQLVFRSYSSTYSGLFGIQRFIYLDAFVLTLQINRGASVRRGWRWSSADVRCRPVIQLLTAVCVDLLLDSCTTLLIGLHLPKVKNILITTIIMAQ